ncbi:MAG: hypothetical protein NC037_01180, partial [Bacteroides sp.]|nr:hypothetical protein [Bacteroides sp.]
DEGINTQVRQTGFLDIYNWQNVKIANFVDTGDAKTNSLIVGFASDIFRYADAFKSCRYIDSDKECYIHMGFVTTGITFSEGIMDEPVYLDIEIEDKRIASDPIRTRELPSSMSNVGAIASTALPILRSMELVFYAYDARSSSLDILPHSTFEFDSNFLKRLHGEN